MFQDLVWTAVKPACLGWGPITPGDPMFYISLLNFLLSKKKKIWKKQNKHGKKYSWQIAKLDLTPDSYIKQQA